MQQPGSSMGSIVLYFRSMHTAPSQLHPKTRLVVCHCLSAAAPARAEAVWVCTQVRVAASARHVVSQQPGGCISSTRLSKHPGSHRHYTHK